MKIKKVTFEHTGKIKTPIKGEWFYNNTTYMLAPVDYDGIKYEIVIRTETVEEWKPRENERYYFPSIYDPNYFDATYFCSNSVFDKNRLQLGLCYPWTDEGRELAIQKAKQILEFLKTQN